MLRGFFTSCVLCLFGYWSCAMRAIGGPGLVVQSAVVVEQQQELGTLMVMGRYTCPSLSSSIMSCCSFAQPSFAQLSLAQLSSMG
jgi:hypothetical protein